MIQLTTFPTVMSTCREWTQQSNDDFLCFSYCWSQPTNESQTAFVNNEM